MHEHYGRIRKESFLQKCGHAMHSCLWPALSGGLCAGHSEQPAPPGLRPAFCCHTSITTPASLTLCDCSLWTDSSTRDGWAELTYFEVFTHWQVAPLSLPSLGCGLPHLVSESSGSHQCSHLGFSFKAAVELCLHTFIGYFYLLSNKLHFLALGQLLYCL